VDRMGWQVGGEARWYHGSDWVFAVVVPALCKVSTYVGSYTAARGSLYGSITRSHSLTTHTHTHTFVRSPITH
jgi:hypothetical protein